MHILHLTVLLAIATMVTATGSESDLTQKHLKEMLQEKLMKRIALNEKDLSPPGQKPADVKDKIKEQSLKAERKDILATKMKKKENTPELSPAGQKPTDVKDRIKDQSLKAERKDILATTMKKKENTPKLNASLADMDACVEKLGILIETLEDIVAEHDRLETRVLTLELENAELRKTLNERNDLQNREECATKDDFRRFLRNFETTDQGRELRRSILDYLERIVGFVPDIIEFFTNFYNSVKTFVETVYNEVRNCFNDLESCLKRALEAIVSPVLESLKEKFLFMLQNGPGIGGPVEVWQGMAHQLRLGETGKCLGYQNNGGTYNFVAENCFDSSSDLKSRFTQDFKLTPSDNCHDTAFDIEIVEFLIRVCNFGDPSTGRNWFIMAEMGAFGHVFARGRMEQTGSHTGTFTAERAAPHPFGIFTRTVKITASVEVQGSEIRFSITEISTNPSVSFIDALFSPLRTSFPVPVPPGINTGGFQPLQDVFNDIINAGPGSTSLCTNGCRYRGDGDCDDGGPDSDYDLCEYGDDCDDCGARPNWQTGPALHMFCTNGCRYRGDGDCDDGGPNSDYDLCDFGDDCDDCGVRESAGKKK